MKEKIKEVLDFYGVTSQQSEIIDEIFNAVVIPVNKDNLPEHEVIAIGYQNESIVGYLHTEIRLGNEQVICDSECTALEQVTHYMDIPKINNTWNK